MTSFKHQNIKYEIASPCDQDWSSMSGDDKCRFCSLCEKNVYNLGSMTEIEVNILLKTEKNVCTRVFKRPDGTILTEDCPVGLKQVRSYLSEKKFLAAGLCLLTIIFSTFSLASERVKIMGKMVARPLVEEELQGEAIETVGAEENWDYKNKEEVKIDKKEYLMGSIAPRQMK
jgi:hypothetical protein